MNYKIENNKIIVLTKCDFCPKHIFECGQVFCYDKINDKHYIAYSEDKKADVIEYDNSIEIFTNDIDYFINYFDLNNDYSYIKQELLRNKIMIEPIKYGYGIRILNQSILETIIEFVISANNNIKRIQKSMFYIREHLGNKKDNYYTFPSLERLSKANEDFFIKAGTGYRAKYLVSLIAKIKDIDLENFKNLDTNEIRNQLILLPGIGPKVADCILLFCLKKRDVFPVDTWIEKVYNDYFTEENNRNIIREKLIKKFKNLSGFGQQYLFYYKREKNKKDYSIL